MTGRHEPAGRRGIRPAHLLLVLTSLALVLRVAWLGSQPLTGDDLAVGQTARNFLASGWPEPTMWNHPRLRDLLVSLSLDTFGNGAWGLKAGSVILGTLSVPATSLLVLSLTGSLPAATVAGLILASDPLHLDFSRQAINDVYLAFLPVAAIAALLRYRKQRSPAWLALAGAFLGLGVATKWSAAVPVGAAGAVVLVEALRGRVGWRDRTVELLLFVSGLALLPVAIYLLTYWPWFGRGHDLGEWLRFQVAMARETATHTGYPGSKLPGFPGEVVGAWRWFAQPIWYVDYIPPMPGREGIPAAGLFLSGVANPIAWMATIPAGAWASWRWLRRDDGVAGWLLLLFLAAWLPFLAVPRPIWTNSALTVIPFSAGLVGWAAARLWADPRCRLPAGIVGAAALLLSVALWPPAVGWSTRPGDGVLRALVSPAALDPANHR